MKFLKEEPLFVMYIDERYTSENRNKLVDHYDSHFKEIGIHVLFMPGTETKLELVYHPNGDVKGENLERFVESCRNALRSDSELSTKLDQIIRMCKLILVE